MTEDRRKEWAAHVMAERNLLRVVAALESFEREVAEHAKREERERASQIAATAHFGELGSRIDLREQIAAAILKGVCE